MTSSVEYDNDDTEVGETTSNNKITKDEAEIGKESPFFPFYSPSIGRNWFSKRSFPTKSPAPNGSSNLTPRRFFRRQFPPPSPAKHIKSVLARQHGSV
ncbi:hypothetical protein SSX86_025140 [Deinandra increscens subsp. villosa]|uniref:Uncharacterized protein n=1 Tax=Deinandra increscens subsp. villosa TaxID=3103831 RepID=A0AAP0CC14_9ASTR